jgi:iron complex outermembrane receptor protein
LKIKLQRFWALGLTLLLLLPIGSLAQCQLQLRGVVKDADTGDPLPYSSVAIKGKAGGIVTDYDGKFILKDLCSGTIRLMVSHLTCEKLDLVLDLDSDTSITVELPHRHNELQEVLVVRSRKDNQPLLPADEISDLQMTRNAGKSLAEGLTLIPGVTMLRSGTSVAKPIVHGLSGSRILILNNGVRLEGQQWGSEHAPEIDPFVAQRLTVIKGSGSVRFGPDAIGGVVLVEPAPLPKGNGWGGETSMIGMSANREGTLSSMIQFSPVKWPAIALRIQGTLKQGGDVRTPHYLLQNTGNREQNFSWSTGWNTESKGVTAFYSQFNNEVGIFTGSHIGNLTDLELAFNRDEPLEQRPFSYTIDRPSQSITHELFKLSAWTDLGSLGKLKLNAARQYNLRAEYDKDLRGSNDSDGSKPELNYEITSKSAEILWEQQWDTRVNSQMGVNIMSQANTFEGRMFIPNYAALNAGTFLIGRFDIGVIELESGCRFDMRSLDVYMRKNSLVQKESYQFESFSGMLSGKWTIQDSSSLLLAVSSGWRPPGVNELYSNGLHHGASSVEIGNIDLQEERSVGFSLSYATIFKNDLKLDAEVFYTSFDGFIYLQPVKPATLTIRGAFPTFKYMQADANLYGLDLSLIKPLSNQWKIQGGGSILRAMNVTRNEWISQMPSDRMHIGLQWTRTAPDQLTQWSVGCSAHQVFKQTRGVVDDYIAAPGSYTLINLEITFQKIVHAHPLDFSIVIENVLDSAYRDYLNRYRYYADEEGANITFRIRKTFGSVDQR